ncbi:MAG: IS1096 element passenger TnpR family protein [Armatimonadota bacterium]
MPHIPSDQAQAAFRRGKEAGADERWAEAQAAFQEALQIDPEYFEALLGLGEAQEAQDDYAAALQTFEHAVQMQPNSADALFGLGVAQYSLERDADAIATFQRALAIRPDHALTLSMLGVAYDILGRTREAQAAYERAVQLDPSEVSAQYNLARIYGQMGRVEEAIAALRQAIAVNPDLVEAYIPLAGMYEMSGRDDEAFDLLRQAILRAPSFPEAHFGLGELYMVRGDVAAARSEYDILKTLDPPLAREFAKRFGFAPKRAATPAGPPRVYQLHITLVDSHPPIWRRVLVTSDTKLSKLHQILQTVMGWTNSHLHEFEVDGERYADPSFHLEEARSERRATLGQVAVEEGDVFAYLYDFGDGWEHAIRVERILPVEPGKFYPVCLEGARACPPEDIGGIPGYEEFLEAIRDPHHPDHDELLQWVGGAFDPEAFDSGRVNQRLQRLKKAA